MMDRFVMTAVLVFGAAVRAGDPVAIRAAIEARLAAMEAAVLAADPAAYMASIATGDAEFTMEQQHWADDLKLHKPVEFDLAVVGTDGPGPTGEIVPATLSMTWTLPEGAQRSVEYPVRFIRQDGVWRYAGEVWTVIEGERVEALCAAELEEAGREVVRAFPAIRAHDEAGFELTVDRVQKVKLYKSLKHLQASIYLSYVDGLGGWNEPGESIKLLASEGSRRRDFDSILAHEFGHVCTFEMGPHAADMPWWALEGAAELAAEEFSRDSGRLDGYIRMLARSGKLGKWENLSDFRSVPLSDYSLVYPQGHHMLAYISEQWGRTGRNAWLRAMAQGRTIDEATREALGLGFTELDAKWRESIGASPEAVPIGD